MSAFPLYIHGHGAVSSAGSDSAALYRAILENTVPPAADGHYVSARRKNSTPGGQPQRGRLLTQHTGLPPRATGSGKPVAGARRKPG